MSQRGHSPGQAKGPGKTTKTWAMYEQLFFLNEDRYPFQIKDLPRGRAINMAMMLNKCNVKYFQSLGAPDSAITLSAKARQEEGKESWLVEVSRNYRRTGGLAPSQQGRGDKSWMDDIMDRIAHETLGTVPVPGRAAPEVILSSPANSPEGAPSEVDSQEEQIRKMYGLDI